MKARIQPAWAQACVDVAEIVAGLPVPVILEDDEE